jgi:hypothetical protein
MDLSSLAKKLDVKKSWLYDVIQIESGWNPSAVNARSGASGLFQFMPSTAKVLGTSVEQIRKDSVSRQLDLAYKMLSPYRGRIHSVYDLYLAVFYPAAIGKSNRFVIGSEKSLGYANLVSVQNPAISKGRNYLTVGDVKKFVREKSGRHEAETILTVIGIVMAADYAFNNFNNFNFLKNYGTRKITGWIQGI